MKVRRKSTVPGSALILSWKNKKKKSRRGEGEKKTKFEDDRKQKTRKSENLR